LLVLVVLAGAALRFYGLDAQSLWNDELSSWEQSHQPTLAEVIEKGVRPTTYPPAYQVLVYYVERWVGDSEKALRFPSAVAGVLAIFAVFFLGKQLYSQREGLIAAALVAFSYQPIYYSQEARVYSFLLLFSILSSHFWFRIAGRLEARLAPDLPSQVGYVACAIVAIYLHYFGLLLVALQLAGLFAFSAAQPRQLARVWSKGKFDYYLERLGATSRVDLRAGTADDVQRVRDYLAAERPDHVWFLLGHRQPEKPFMAFLDQELELVFHVPLRGAFARLYRRREAGSEN
jgi:4-amino-4-deoxy-L-arabinose transferase-like glycosyltransferase